MNKAQLINQTSGDFEYYTPLEIIAAARVVMGSIKLDPASSLIANRRIMADGIFTVEDDGLKKKWVADTLWLNHPFSRTSNPLWINKLMREFRCRSAKEAMCITYACTSEAWFRPLLEFPQCYLYPRTNYYLPDGTIKKGVTKGSVVTYLSIDFNNIFKFREVFESNKLGKVKI
jgi:hypothetical protein